MSVVYELTMSLKADGAEVFGQPLTKRLTVDETTGLQTYERATGGGYSTLNITVLETLQLLFVQASQSVTLRLDGQSDAGIVLQANGLLLLMGGTVDAGSSTNATLDNSSGQTAVVKVLGGGT